MKKSKKILQVVGICAAFVVLLLAICSLVFKPGKKENLKAGEITDLKETQIGKVPEFAIIVRGDYKMMIQNDDIEKMKAYEFDGTVDNGWTVEKNHYVGIRVKDAFEYLKINEYEEVEFFSKGRVTVTYKREDITDDVYFVIKRDGKLLGDTVFNLVSFDKDYHYSLENMVRVTVAKKGQ